MTTPIAHVIHMPLSAAAPAAPAAARRLPRAAGAGPGLVAVAVMVLLSSVTGDAVIPFIINSPRASSFDHANPCVNGRLGAFETMTASRERTSVKAEGYSIERSLVDCRRGGDAIHQ